jgi:ATP phosphoribosyltransferase
VAQLPALNFPTISHLSDPAWVALNTIIDEAVVREVIPKAEGGRRDRDCRVSAEQGCSLSTVARLLVVGR